MDQIEKLNKDLGYLLYAENAGKRVKRKIKLDHVYVSAPDLTKDEIFLIRKAIERQRLPIQQSRVVYISRRYYLDFIGFDDPKYYDVLICKK